MNGELKLLSSLLPEDRHLEYEELEEVARGAENEHVQWCETCAAEVDDLRALWSDGLSARRRRPERPALQKVAVAAAAVLIVVIAAALLLRRNRAADLRLAEVPIPADVIAMRGERLQLRGALGDADMAVLEPLGTAVVSDRPLFRWSAPESLPVRVEVFDEHFRPIAQSGVLTSHQWTAATPLPRGQTYVWQVVSADGSQLAPVPPLPDARFRIVSSEAATRIEAARDAEPSLELASLYAASGALDDASRELDRLIAAGRDGEAVRRLRNRIDNLR